MTTRELFAELAAIATDFDTYLHPMEVLDHLIRVISGQVCDDTVCPWPVGLPRSERQQREQQILAIARNTDGTVCQETLRPFFRYVAPETLRLSLVRLCQRGMLVKVGDKRGTVYVRRDETSRGGRNG